VTDSDPAASAPGLLRAVQIMDRLRSPGGCPWDAAQTHQTLAPYLLEEAYETLEAIETGNAADLREELGDLLLQVLFHARLAQEGPDGAEPFDVNDVAGDLADKLIRRHPHVFADSHASTEAEVSVSWEKIKRAEKARTSATDGVAMGQPALSLAAKLVNRSAKAGVQVPLPSGDGVGERLLALVAEAAAAGVDPELALRDTARRYRAEIRAAEGVAP
jgi:XTP/dITP diphosphohydrolase